jgi:type II restriction enzyme
MTLHAKNIRLITDLRKRWYFAEIEHFFAERVRRVGLPDALDYLTEVMREAQPVIEGLLDQRVQSGIINDKRQARVSVAGNGFQGLVAYALAECQQVNLLDNRLIFVLKPKEHELVKAHASIKIANEIQKPDFDLLVYCDGADSGAIGIFSLKTSLRERAGQTYRWKLLLDIATADNSVSLKKKYGLEYEHSRPILVSLITADFYNEVNSPQQRGAFSFFHSVYVTKPLVEDNLVKSFSLIVPALNR